MVTSNLFLDSRFAKNGESTLKMIIRKDRRQALLNLGIKVKLTEWDSARLRYIGQSAPLRALIQNRKSIVEYALYRLMSDVRCASMSATEIRDTIAGEISLYCPTETIMTKKSVAHKEGNFVKKFKDYIATCRTEGTRSIYSQTLLKIMQFAPDANDLDFEDIDHHWLTSFDEHISRTMKSANAKAVHFRNIRAVFNSAIDDEITSSYPFRKFKITTQDTQKRSLSVKHMRILLMAELKPWMERYRDFFMLSFMLCGINTIDLCGLDGIINGRVEYRRAKTHKLYSIKVEPEASAIMERYKGCDQLLNILDCYGKAKDFNRKLKRGLDAIVEHINAGLPRTEKLPRISSYWARHTWATLAADLDIPIETISAALGHAHGCATTAIYIRFNNKKIDAANRKVLDWVLYDKR